MRHGLRVGLLLRPIEPLHEVAARGGQFTQPHEGTHKIDRHLDGARTIDPGGGYQRPLLGKHSRRIAQSP